MKALTGRCLRSPDVSEGMMTEFADAERLSGRRPRRRYSMGFFSAKHLGSGSVLLMTIVDKNGQPFDGAS